MSRAMSGACSSTMTAPRGQEDYDIQRPGSASHADSKARIARVALPEADPVAGPDGPLMSAWGVSGDAGGEY